MPRWISTLISTSLMGGCLPIPHRAPITPEIRGSVAFAPEGSRVVLSTTRDDANCIKLVEASADPATHFHFARQTRFRPVVTMMDVAHPVSVCLITETSREQLWSATYIVQPREVTLTCDLSKPRSALCILEEIPSPTGTLEHLESFLSVPVAARLDEAVAEGDLRFLAIYGYTLSVPGIPDDEWGPGDAQVIPGTSDTLPERLSDQVRDYAVRYNLGVLASRD